MSKSTKDMAIVAGIALVVAAGVVWASNNIDQVEKVIG